MSQESIPSNRLIEFDIMRIIAVCAVCMIHLSSAYTASFDSSNSEFCIGNIFNASSRIAVPFFILLSGFFMLEESKEVSYVRLGKKVIRLVILAIFWSLYYATFYDKETNFWTHFIYGHYHIWYLWFCVGLYLMTPILRLFVKQENIKYLYYFVILFVCLNYIPRTIDAFLNKDDAVLKFTSMFKIGLGTEFMAYYILGWLINKNLKVLSRYTKILLAISLLSITTIVLCGRYLTRPYNVLAFKLYNEGELLVLLYSCSLFVVLVCWFSKIKDRFPQLLNRFIFTLSKLSFGVYLVHVIFLNLSFKILLGYYPDFGVKTKIALGYLFTVIASFLCCWIISRIKYLSELIKL